MPRDIELPGGQIIRNVPDAITDGGALDLAVQRGIISPQDAAQTLGDRQAMAGPDTGGVLNEIAIGAGKSVADLSFGLLDNDAALPNTVAAGVGYALPGIAASLLAPGTVAAQAAVGGGLGFAQSGGDLQQGAQGALMGGGGAALGNMASRVMQGIGQARQPVQRTLGQRLDSDLLRRAEAGLSSGGGFDFLRRNVTRELNRTAARSIGMQADELTPAVLQEAAERIGSIFDNIIPPNSTANIAGIREAIDALPAGAAGARVTRALGADDVVRGENLNALRTALAQRSRALMGEAPASADDLALILDDVDNIIAGVAGEDVLPLLRIAREGWKNLRLLEGMPTVRASGNVSPRQALGKFAADRGYGETFTRNRGGVLPETQQMFDVVRDAARLTEIVGDSGTATRLAALGLTGAVFGAALEGDIEGAAKYAAIGLSPALIGRVNVGIANAALGQGSQLATRLGGAAGIAANQ